jgi:hypothetical protein
MHRWFWKGLGELGRRCEFVQSCICWNGRIFFGYYPDLFAVCGTGLETTEMLLAGQTATVGTYDGAELWDFIRFDEHFAVWGQGHERWWAEYGDTAMEILDSAVFGK